MLSQVKNAMCKLCFEKSCPEMSATSESSSFRQPINKKLGRFITENSKYPDSKWPSFLKRNLGKADVSNEAFHV